jgi:nitrogen regulatory protein PII
MENTAKAKLITIIATAELRERLEEDLRRLGATGYTVERVDGRGHSGPRMRGVFELGNVRMETIVPIANTDPILTHLATLADQFDLVAFVQDIDALPRKRFV